MQPARSPTRQSRATSSALALPVHASLPRGVGVLGHLDLDVLEGGEARRGLDGAGQGTRRKRVEDVHFPLTLLQPPRHALECGEAYRRPFVVVDTRKEAAAAEENTEKRV